MPIQVHSALLVVVVLVVVSTVWFILRIKLMRENRERPREVDRYLYRTDLGSGAAPAGSLEWLIALITTRRILVHSILLGGTVIAAIFAWTVGYPSLAGIFAFGAFLFLIFGAIFVIVPHLEAMFYSDSVDQLPPLQSMSTVDSTQKSSKLVPEDGHRTVDRPTPRPSNVVDAKVGIIYAVFVMLLITILIILIEGIG